MTVPTPKPTHRELWVQFAAAALGGETTGTQQTRDQVRRAADAADWMVAEYVKRFEQQNKTIGGEDCPF